MAFKRSAVRSRLSPPGKRKALEVSFQGFSFRSWSYPSFGPVAQLGERSVRIREVESSNLFRSTRRTLDGHLLFQKRLCRDGAALMSKRTAEVKVWKPWPPLFYRSIPFCPVLLLPDRRRPPVRPHACSRMSARYRTVAAGGGQRGRGTARLGPGIADTAAVCPP